MSESRKWVTRDGSIHTVKPLDKRQMDEIRSHQRLILERQGLAKPLHGKNRTPLYPAPAAPVSRRTQTEPQQDINTCVGEYTSRGDLSLESLSDLRNRSEFAGCFNLDIMTRSDEDSQLLMGAGFRMVGSAQKSEQGEMVLYRRWRLNLRGE